MSEKDARGKKIPPPKGADLLSFSAYHDAIEPYLKSIGKVVLDDVPWQHVIMYTKREIKCVKDCPALNYHLDEYRALDVQGG